MSSEKKVEDLSVANPNVVTKFKLAGDIAEKALKAVVAQCVAGAKVAEVCAAGDKLLSEETAKVFNNQKIAKGIAFPTSLSVNDCVAHNSAASTSEETLKEGDVVKVTVGAHIDGFPSTVAETVVVGGGEITGELADALAAAHYASELALRTFKAGNRNWDVTNVVDKVAKIFGATPVEGMLSQQHLQNEIDGKKKIIFNPSADQRREFESVQFAENEVYGLDILIAAGDSGKTFSKDTPTTLYKKANRTYQLKLRTSRIAISDIQKKAGTFPFNIEILEDQKRARMALQEPINHNLVEPLDIVYTKSGKPVVQLLTTFAITKNGILKLASPSFDIASVKTDKKIEDEELLKLLSTSLKVNKKKAKKAAKAQE